MCRNNQELLEVTFAGERAGDHGFNSRTTGRSLIKRWNCMRSTSFQIKGETSETVHVEKSSEVTNNTVEWRDSLFLKRKRKNPSTGGKASCEPTRVSTTTLPISATSADRYTCRRTSSLRYTLTLRPSSRCQSNRKKILVTGIKVVDLLAPYVKDFRRRV
ncbi:uncharacterized protein LOC110385500 isoform X1 [Bombyx mori]|uniref:uncharacterized protein LOC110385500 isoform X1 n=1 Tax=Bombyx mori TaxID=7091 RepID=UPI002ED5A64F